MLLSWLQPEPIIKVGSRRIERILVVSSTRRIIELIAITTLAIAAGQVAVMAQARFGEKQLAERPKFSDEQRSVFFPDARLELGPGEPGRQPVADSKPAPMPTKPKETATKTDDATWSGMVSGEAIEDEIKSYVPAVAEHTRSLNAFKSGGYQEIRDSYSVLAVLFGVIAQYDGQVRWKDEAAGMRAALSRAGFNCKVATDASFKESKLRGEDLATLVRGGFPELPEAATLPEDGWASVSDRPPLMKRMEQSQRGRLNVWTSNAGEFESNFDELLQEANLLRLMTEVIRDPSYEFAEDELYLEYVDAMQTHCDVLIEAIEQDRFEDAQSAVRMINQQCDNCHGDYRG